MKVGASQTKVGDELMVKIITVPPSEGRERGEGREVKVGSRKEGRKVGDGKRDWVTGGQPRLCVGSRVGGGAGELAVVCCLLSCCLALDKNQIRSAQRTGGPLPSRFRVSLLRGFIQQISLTFGASRSESTAHDHHDSTGSWAVSIDPQ